MTQKYSTVLMITYLSPLDKEIQVGSECMGS